MSPSRSCGRSSHGHLPQQLVAGRVAAGVVDDLELVEIEIQHGVVRVAVAVVGQDPLQPVLELAPVDEPRQRVVAREMRQPGHVFALPALVLEHQHGADDVPLRSRMGATL